jgi:hypothetical protein
LASARNVFGEEKIEANVRASQVLSALCHMGFPRGGAVGAIGHLGPRTGLEVEQLLRKCLGVLVPASAEAVCRTAEGRQAA